MAGRGIVAREPGQTYKNTNGDALQFIRYLIFEPHEDDMNGIDSYVQSHCMDNSLYLTEVNGPNKAAILAIFENTETKKKEGFVRYFKYIRDEGRYMWTDAVFFRDTGFKRQTGRSAAETVPIKPTDLIEDDLFYNVREVENSVVDNAPQPFRNYFIYVIDRMKRGEPGPVVFRGGRRHIPTINKYMGEVLAPMALVYGWEIPDSYLINDRKATIRYPQDAKNVLIDSEVVTGDTKIQISSKAGHQGAATSAHILFDILSENGFDSDFYNKYAREIQLIKIIHEHGQYEGPLVAAEALGILDYGEAKKILSGSLESSPNVCSLREHLTTDHPPGYNKLYHTIAGVAKVLIEEANAHMDIDGFARELLRRKKGFIQMNSHAGYSGEDALFKGFTIRNPSDFDGSVVLSARKNYFTTNITGKITFKLKRNIS
jgi:hypothetical protein